MSTHNINYEDIKKLIKGPKGQDGKRLFRYGIMWFKIYKR